jgi:hypothetical protein
MTVAVNATTAFASGGPGAISIALPRGSPVELTKQAVYGLAANASDVYWQNDAGLWVASAPSSIRN